MIVTFRGNTWGDHGDAVQIISASGLEDWSSDPVNRPLAGDGSLLGRLRVKPKELVLDVLVLAADADEMATELDALRVAFWPEDQRTTLYPLGFTLEGQTERFVFVRCVAQQIPTEFETSDRYLAARCQFALASNDAQVYGAEVEVELAPAATTTITGTIPSREGRLRAVIAGPATNPQLASSLDASAKVRYVGTVASGSNLVLEWSPGYLLTKVVADADLGDEAAYGVGTNVYGALDGGSGAGANRPPQWFPLTYGAQTITYTTTAGAGECTLTYRLPSP